MAKVVKLDTGVKRQIRKVILKQSNGNNHNNDPLSLFISLSGEPSFQVVRGCNTKREGDSLFIINYHGELGIPSGVGLSVDYDVEILGAIASPVYINGKRGDVTLCLPRDYECEIYASSASGCVHVDGVTRSDDRLVAISSEKGASANVYHGDLDRKSVV